MYSNTSSNKKFKVVLCFLFLFLISCLKEPEAKFSNEVKMKLEEMPDQIAKDLLVEFLDSSLLRAKLSAKIGKVFYQRGETWLYDSIKVDFFSRANGRRQSILTADSAKINDRTKDMFAYGKVVVVADSPKIVLKTSFLEWRNKSQRLYSNEYIEITTPEEEIRGYGFESDLNLTNYKIFRVSGVRK